MRKRLSANFYSLKFSLSFQILALQRDGIQSLRDVSYVDCVQWIVEVDATSSVKIHLFHLYIDKARILIIIVIRFHYSVYVFEISASCSAEIGVLLILRQLFIADLLQTVQPIRAVIFALALIVGILARLMRLLTLCSIALKLIIVFILY